LLQSLLRRLMGRLEELEPASEQEKTS
jgi:hypothetical protein